MLLHTMKSMSVVLYEPVSKVLALLVVTNEALILFFYSSQLCSQMLPPPQWAGTCCGSRGILHWPAVPMQPLKNLTGIFIRE